jgi:hypothetical protein
MKTRNGMRLGKEICNLQRRINKRQSNGAMLDVITQFWVIPQKSLFFKIKIKKIK